MEQLEHKMGGNIIKPGLVSLRGVQGYKVKIPMYDARYTYTWIRAMCIYLFLPYFVIMWFFIMCIVIIDHGCFKVVFNLWGFLSFLLH